MNRRMAAVAALFVLTALSALAADPARSREAALPLEEHAPIDLRALFDRAPGVVESVGGGVTVSAFAFDVIVARIEASGELTKACVHSEEEARRFLTAPVEKIEKAGGHEQ